MPSIYLQIPQSSKQCNAIIEKSAQTNQNERMSKRRRLRICTVGDGDLTFSLALCRALGEEQIDRLTATVLPESEELLVATYATAADSLQQLREGPWRDRVDVRFGVDATTNFPSSGPYDVVMFNHPHLGNALLADSEKEHAKRHHSLLAHYLHSASQCLPAEGGGGAIHLCLCGSQPTTWDVAGAAERNGLEIFHQCGTAGPVGEWLSLVLRQTDADPDPLVVQPTQSGWPAPRRYRNGKLGSKHFLGRYGYRHRRTGGDAYSGNDNDMTVDGSVNILLRRKQGMSASMPLPQIIEGLDRSHYCCRICDRAFETEALLESHLQSPASPDAHSTHRDDETGKEFSSAYGLETFKCQRRRQREEEGKTGGDITGATIDATACFTSGEKEKKARVGSYDEAQDSANTQHVGVLAQSSVSSEFDGKRLRWYCRQAKEFTAFVKSKKHCEDLIKAGRVHVNEKAVNESSRVVRSGDQIAIVADLGSSKELVNSEGEATYPRPETGVKIIRMIGSDGSLIAMKPSKMRTNGAFSEDTLDSQVSAMRNGKRYSSMTKLETSCEGVCYVVPVLGSDPHEKRDISILYRYSALVFGHVPQNWSSGVYVSMPSNGCRRWKNSSRSQYCAQDADGAKADAEEESYVPRVSTSPSTGGEQLFVRCISRTIGGNSETLTLTSLIVESDAKDGKLCSAISFVLRKLGHGVVNDRFCKREGAELPRIVRNRLKKKTFIGCYGLQIRGVAEAESIEVPVAVPDRLKTAYWDALLTGRSSCEK